MGEIINIQAGQCGNQLGQKFWEGISQEHGINPEGKYVGDNSLQLERISTLYNENSRGKYTPRAILVDFDPAPIDAIRNSSYSKLFSPDSFHTGKHSTGNNWAKGFVSGGTEHVEPIMDIIRKEVERADCLQGFHLFHSISGGTGSGFGSLLLERIGEEYYGNVVSTFSVLPSPKSSDIVVEPYNAALAFYNLLPNSNINYCIDNEALTNICLKNYKIQNPSYDNLNQCVFPVMSGISVGQRFPGQLNNSVRKLLYTLVPFPSLHFLMVGATLNTQTSPNEVVSDLASKMFDPQHLMISLNPRYGRYFTAATIFRGRIAAGEVTKQMLDIQNKNASNFIEWIPNNINVSLCDFPLADQNDSGVFIGNHSAFSEVFRRIGNSAYSLIRKKAYIHWYISEGIDEMELNYALDRTRDLQIHYEQHQKEVDDNIED